jgi:hypothetical protein
LLKDAKSILGIVLLVLSCLVPLSGFWIANLPLPVAMKGTLIGLLTVGAPELLALAAIALLGKQAFDLITSKALSVLSRLAPRGSVSKTRYKVGLALLLVSCVPTYIMGYAPHLLPDSSPARLYVAIGSDLAFIVSLFVLGGDFWDKFRALFIYEAKAHFP